MRLISFILLLVILLIRLIRYISVSPYRDEPFHPDYQKDREPPIQVPREEEPEGEYFFTNAPEHWGLMTDGFLSSNKRFVQKYDGISSDRVTDRREWMVNSLVLMGKINTELQKLTSEKVNSGYGGSLFDCEDQYATSCCVEKLFEKGVISTTGVVIDNYERFAVMLFDKVVSAAYIDELRDHFISDGYKDLICYTVADPDTITVKKTLKFENFNKSCFNFDKAKQGNRANWSYENYAMWWSSEKDPDVARSRTVDELRVCLDLLDFHNSYALGILSFAFGLKDNNNRTKLPENDMVLIKGPEGVEIVMSLSAKQGINFHFPVDAVFESYRDKFVKVYLNFCYDIRAQILEDELPNDDFETVSTLLWFDGLLKDAQNGGQPVNSIGLLTRQIAN